MNIRDINEYVHLAMRTLAPEVEADTFKMHMNAVTGLASETGEINEIMKKHYFHGHPLDAVGKDHLKKELGDLAWYWALMCYANGFDASEVLSLNIAKLKARYPEGFSTERSINRSKDDI